MNRPGPTIRIRAPRDIVEDLRMKFPGMRDADLIRVTYNASFVKPEIKLTKVDFKRKLWGK